MRLIAALAFAAILALLGGTWFLTQGTPGGDQFAQCRASNVAGGAGAIGGPFELVNGQGETVTDEDVITAPTLIYFGYTFCPDVCPLDNVRNAEAIDLLEERGHEVTPVCISVDPERDTPEVVGEFAYYMHDRMIGLTGSPEQVKAASQAYKTYYRAQEAVDDFYLVDHSTFSYLVFPEHGFVEFFRRDLSAEAVAESVGCFVENA